MALLIAMNSFDMTSSTVANLVRGVSILVHLYRFGPFGLKAYEAAYVFEPDRAKALIGVDLESDRARYVIQKDARGAGSYAQAVDSRAQDISVDSASE